MRLVLSFFDYLEECIKNHEVLTTEEAAAWYIQQNLSARFDLFTERHLDSYLDSLEYHPEDPPKWFRLFYKSDAQAFYAQLLCNEDDITEKTGASLKEHKRRLLYVLLKCYLETMVKTNEIFYPKLQRLYGWKH
jgi:hypothetical protein